MSVVPRTIHVGFLLSLLVFLISWSQRDRLPELNDLLPASFAAPIQTLTDSTALTPARQDGQFHYEVEPLFDYQLNGLVVSLHRSRDDLGFNNHEAWGDVLNTADLCVMWGDNLRSGIYHRMTFSNGDWTCYAKFKNATTREEWLQFKGEELSNNHVLPGNLNVEAVINSIRPGDQIRLKGKLVQYRRQGSSGGFRRSSIVRTDSGNGACEIIYVTDAEILKSGHPIWQWLYGCSAILTGLFGITAVIHHLRLWEILLEFAARSSS